jgi:hypothetical protein
MATICPLYLYKCPLEICLLIKTISPIFLTTVEKENKKAV